jgi:uncharacterized membrane protein YqjE
MASKAQDPGLSRGGGLSDSLRVLAATLLAILHTRVELLSTELEEQRVWLSSMLVWALVGVFCAGIGIVLATLFAVLALWETHRLLALGIPAMVFVLGAGLAWLVVRGKARAKPPMFAASLAELDKDHKELTSRS